MDCLILRDMLRQNDTTIPVSDVDLGMVVGRSQGLASLFQ